MPRGKFGDMKFTDKSKEAMQTIRNAGEENFTDFIETMEEKAKEYSPVAADRGGNNRSSIKARGKWGNRLVLNFEIFTESGYGAYLELGTKKKKSNFYPGAYVPGQWRPYMAPAYRFAHKQLEKTKPKDWE